MVKRFCFFAVVFALIVVMLGAYTRLTDAGLGCPDWPGCYGEMIVPQTDGIEHGKAWTEMVHRYVAGTLGLMILGFFVFSWRKESPLYPCRGLTTTLLITVIFQALLGMWTVTLLLHPTIVMGHLLGGMTIISLLWLLYLRVSPMPATLAPSCGLRLALALGLFLVIIQIALGGWTSANYAAMACTDFPMCREQWIPELHIREAFSLLPSFEHNYEGGWLAHPARVTIHFLHRVFAVIVLVYVGALSIWLATKNILRQQSLITLGLLLTQVALGVSNILFLLPLPVATAHNGVAALLLLALVTLNARYWQLSGLTHSLPLSERGRGGFFSKGRDYLELTKPKVVLLMLITALVGMYMATPYAVPLPILFFGSLGIALAAGSAAVLNHLADQRADVLMRRTQNRPLPTKKVSPRQALLFSGLLGLTSLTVLTIFVNPLTALLSFLSLIGYAGVYTLILKRLTPQNIVIGGLAGATPPLLGWTAVTGEISAHALLLVLIIYTWTPPHFWSLAVHRVKDYRNANIPMLPVTHGVDFTKTCILLYTILLFGVSLLPYIMGMSHLLYLITAAILGLGFLVYALRLKFFDQPQLAIHTFHYSNIYLCTLFTVLLVDHYL